MADRAGRPAPLASADFAAYPRGRAWSAHERIFPGHGRSRGRHGGASPVAYPDGYRHWTHVKSATVNPASPAYAHFGGMHHIYANKPAMRDSAEFQGDSR